MRGLPARVEVSFGRQVMREVAVEKRKKTGPTLPKLLSPWQRIMRAARRGEGIGLDEEEVRQLSRDQAIAQKAMNDDHRDQTGEEAF
jgi:hypothetical protein